MKKFGINKEDVIFKKLQIQYPSLSNISISETNWRIFEYVKFFCDDPAILASSLIQNPIGKTTGLSMIRKQFGADISSTIKSLNHLYDNHSQNNQALKNFSQWKNIVILYLANHVIFYETHPQKKNDPYLNKKKIKSALKLLEHLDISEIRSRLEDPFFSIVQPEIYNNYHSLLKFTRKKYLTQQKHIIREFERILKKGKIKAIIESRLKTIYSIHHKIIKKNILLSQVLDSIGLRVLVETEDDCYRAMVLILKKSPIMTSMVKDYIAIPKQNGYQSIHLTIFYDEQPVEIQIRTFEMHRFAQFGPASHFEYKKDSNYG